MDFNKDQLLVAITTVGTVEIRKENETLFRRVENSHEINEDGEDIAITSKKAT